MMNFLIISGMSGAGKSRAVASMEDLGYYCVDNLPLALIPTFAEVCLNAAERYEHVALCTDVRAGGNFDQLFASLDAIKSMGCEVQILFLDTDTSTLINRFKETRRKHPLMENGLGMLQAIERERTLLEGIRPDGQIEPEAEARVMNELRAHFRPEFLNRLDETILFKPLTRENIGGIVELIVADLNRRLADRDLSLELTEEAERFIVDNAYDPVYGARPLKRYIQKHVETLTARLILSDGVGSGDTVVISVEDGRLKASVKYTA